MMSMNKWLAGALIGCGLLAAAPTQAIDCDCEHETGLTTSSWVKKFRINGDFRTRYEYFSNDDRADQDSRHRFQVRGRLNTAVDLCDWVQINFRLATETSDDNSAVDSHRTLTGKFSKFEVGLDRAFATFMHPDYDYIAGHFGKVRNFAYQPDLFSPMLFDYDLNPEGSVLTFDYAMNDEWSFFGHGAFYTLSERTGLGAANDDVYMWVLDVGTHYQAEWFDGDLVFSYYGTTNLDKIGPTALGQGNLLSGGLYVDDFNVIALQGEVNIPLGDEDILYTENVVRVMGGFVMNLSDDYKTAGGDHRLGYTAQLVYGRAHMPMTWELGVQYKWQEADSVIDCFTDSNWGYGGTDRKGWVLAGKYAVCSWWNFGLQAYFTEKISHRTGGNSVPGMDDKCLSRVQLDTNLVF